MAPAQIVPTLDELEDRHTGLRLGLEFATVEQPAFRLPKTLSHITLSYASPTEPMDGRAPASLQHKPKAIDVY